MGDKNRTARITTTSSQVKTGHGILKAVYVVTPGDEIFEVIDGTLDSDTTIMSIDTDVATSGHIFLAPYINRPMNAGIRVQVVSGTTGELLVVFE